MDGCREGTHWEVVTRELKSPMIFNMQMWCEKGYGLTAMTLNKKTKKKTFPGKRKKYLNI